MIYESEKPKKKKIIQMILITLVSCLTEWGFFCIGFTLIWYIFRDDVKKRAIWFTGFTLFYNMLALVFTVIGEKTWTFPYELLGIGVRFVAMMMSLVLITFFYNGKKGGSPWCDIFVDYLFLKCFGYKDALRLLCQPEKSLGAACRYSLKYYKRQGRFDKEPKIGSQIFFNDAAGVSHHTGIVENFDSTKVYTIEGNQGNQVCRKTYSRNYNRIAGYGHPEYDDSTPANNGEDDSIEERVLHINVDSSKYDTVKLTIIKE